MKTVPVYRPSWTALAIWFCADVLIIALGVWGFCHFGCAAKGQDRVPIERLEERAR